MDLFERRFSQAQAGFVTGVPVEKIRVWYGRKHLKHVEEEGDEKGAAGLAHRLSARSVLRIAITNAISAFVPPSQASSVVAQFMDRAGGGSGWVGDVEANDVPRRSPGGLFDKGETFLCIFDDGRKPVVASYQPGEEFEPDRDGKYPNYYRIHLNPLVETVLRGLERLPSTPAAHGRGDEAMSPAPLKAKARAKVGA